MTTDRMPVAQESSTEPSDRMARRQEAEQVLRKTWGYEQFRPGQWDVIEAVLDGRDALALLPTGGGKSLCYQVPALMNDGLCLVITPLIALMHDQVAGLRARGVEAAFIDSSLSQREIDQRWTDAEFGRFQLLYVAPERLQTEMFVARADRLPVSFVAVDEAHCVSEWGHHFRPAYLDIPEARLLLGDVPTLAVTATATPEVRRDIVDLLDLHDPYVQVTGFDRPNIVWSVFHVTDKRDKVRSVLKGVPGSGILYASTRKRTEQWAAWLQQEGVSAEAYHGGLDAATRQEVQERWIDGDLRVIAATNAFGMGIDKPDVRFVIHGDLPGSIEAYYQEAGRAGRDGAPAYAVLLYREADRDTQQSLIEETHPTAATVRAVYDAVSSLGQVPVGSLPDGPVLLDYDLVTQVAECSPTAARTAVELIVRQGVWQLMPPRRHKGLIRFRQPAPALRRYADGLNNAKLADFVRDVLRAVHADAYSDWWDIDLRLLARRTSLDRPRLARGLDFLHEQGLLDWRPPGQANHVIYLEPRTQQLPVEQDAVKQALHRARTKLRYMNEYAQRVACRRHTLLAYFGEASPEPCGACDVCLGRHEQTAVTARDEPDLKALLAAALVTGRPVTDPPLPERRQAALVDWLVGEGHLRLDEPVSDRYTVTESGRQMLDF